MSSFSFFKPSYIHLINKSSNINAITLTLWQQSISAHLLGLLCIYEMPFYAVAVGKVPGVYKTWDECQNQTKGHRGAKYRKFNTKEEALNFIQGNGLNNVKLSKNDTTTTSTSSTSFVIENLRPPELKAVNQIPSHSFLKQDKLSLITSKVDSFIEKTNKTLDEFQRRLDLLQNLLSSDDSQGKRKIEPADEVKEKRCSKKKKTLVTVETKDDTNEEVTTRTKATRSKSQASNENETVEETDGPWGNYNNLPHDGFILSPDGYVVVYTDGACSNNGKNCAKAGLGVWFNHRNPYNLAAPVEGIATNNNAEIQAATRAIEQANLAGIKRLNIHTDSQFMINCITEWMKKWKKNNWVTSNGGAVKNKEQLELLDRAIQSMEAVKWTHIRGHMGIEGNECADALARSGAAMY